jgi:hypothetical protein
MVRLTEHENLAVTLWVRDQVATGTTTNHLLQSLKSLEARGAIDTLTLNVWGSQVQQRPAHTLPGSQRRIRSRIAAFKT